MYEVKAFDGLNDKVMVLGVEDTEKDAYYLAYEYSISFGVGWKIWYTLLN